MGLHGQPCWVPSVIRVSASLLGLPPLRGVLDILTSIPMSLVGSWICRPLLGFALDILALIPMSLVGSPGRGWGCVILAVFRHGHLVFRVIVELSQVIVWICCLGLCGGGGGGGKLGIRRRVACAVTRSATALCGSPFSRASPSYLQSHK